MLLSPACAQWKEKERPYSGQVYRSARLDDDGNDAARLDYCLVVVTSLQPSITPLITLVWMSASLYDRDLARKIERQAETIVSSTRGRCRTEKKNCDRVYESATDWFRKISRIGRKIVRSINLMRVEIFPHFEELFALERFILFHFRFHVGA